MSFELFGGFGRRHIHRPWDGAPPWALEIRKMLGQVLSRESIEMSRIDDLNNVVTALATAAAASHAAVINELKALADARAQASQIDPALDAAISQAIANIQNTTQTVASDSAALTASVPAATTVPAPPVEPPISDTNPTSTPPTVATPAVTDPQATPPSAPPADATTQPVG
jgi:hypothetical protein